MEAYPGLQGSDNTRHRSHHPVTGEPYLLPPHRIRRVVLCTGQMYYRLRCASVHSAAAAEIASRPFKDLQRCSRSDTCVRVCCSNARRAAKVRDIVMVRLEQIAPFPHDLVMKARMQRGVWLELCLHCTLS